MPSLFALQRAGLAWCKPATKDKAMDLVLAEAFAEIIDEMSINQLRGGPMDGMRFSRSDAVDPDVAKRYQAWYDVTQEDPTFNVRDMTVRTHFEVYEPRQSKSNSTFHIYLHIKLRG